jgi:hypothetical protein
LYISHKEAEKLKSPEEIRRENLLHLSSIDEPGGAALDRADEWCYATIAGRECGE